MGWTVLPEYQGQGLASAAVRLAAAHAATHGHRRHAHAYPKGTPIRCHDWRLDPTALRTGPVTRPLRHREGD